MSQHNKVIVIGGGLAGLSAAHTILENGGSVVLLDKSAFLGGNSTKATSGINGACQFMFVFLPPISLSRRHLFLFNEEEIETRRFKKHTFYCVHSYTSSSSSFASNKKTRDNFNEYNTQKQRREKKQQRFLLIIASSFENTNNSLKVVMTQRTF